MKLEKVYSKINDPGIHKDIANSPIWEEAHHEDEVADKSGLIQYSIKFDGLKPIQVTNITKFK